MTQSEFSSTMPIIEIQLSPLEDDDLETIAALEIVEDTLKRDTTALKDYKLVNIFPQAGDNTSKTRDGGDTFHFISTLTQAIYNQQDFMKIMIGAGITALTLLLKQRRVKKVEVKLGEKKLLIEQADQRAVQVYIQQFETLCREEATETLTPSPKLEIKAHVSKKSTPTKDDLS